MNLTWSTELSQIDWQELCDLYKAAPLGSKDIAKLEITFTNSMFHIFLYDDDRIIGVGRALADGFDCSYICDIALHPDYQGTGLGKEIVKRLVDMSRGHKKIILYSNPGKEGFYAKLGFKKMNTAMAIFENEDAMVENGTIATDA